MDNDLQEMVQMIHLHVFQFWFVVYRSLETPRCVSNEIIVLNFCSHQLNIGHNL